MEAATPLRKPHVRTLGDQLVVESLTVRDETTVRVVREREESGEDPAAAVANAIEIGARVLDREQAGANADFVRAEFEKTARELETEFTDKARKVAEHFGDKVDEVFGPEDGVLAKSLAELFSDGSSSAVQNRVKEIVADVMARSREDLLKQFSAADGQNPLADFKKGTLAVLKQADERQHATQTALLERMGQLEKQLQSLRDEKEKLEAVEAERERGTAKGRTFEEQVAEALEEVAAAQGDCAEAVGDLKGATRKTGDVVVSIGAAGGPARGRLVFEAKNAKLSQPDARRELDRGLAERDADFAVLVVPAEAKVPARMQLLREYDGDKLVVTFDPDDGGRLALELGYRLARARVLMARAESEGVDTAAVRAVIERALLALGEVRRIKSQLTGAESSIDGARDILDAMATQVKGQLAEIDALVDVGGDPAGGGQGELDV